MKVKAQKQPIVVEAVQYDGENQKEIEAFMETGSYVHNFEKFMIVTPEGNMIITEGDWVIRGVNGEYYPCKPDIFQKSYSIVEVETDNTSDE